MNEPPDERSQIAVAYAWAARITTISLEMVIPGMLGYWLDHQLGVLPAFTLIGFSLGMTLGIWHLVKLTSPPKSAKRTASVDQDDAVSNSSDTPL